MKTLLTALAPLLLITPALVSADALPIDPGLWEFTSTNSNPFNFKNVEVSLCPTQGGACNNGTPTLSGGVMTATQ